MRHRALIEDNLDIIKGARVLDIASHDGRWTLAALEAGAAHVIGVEARPELVESAHDTLSFYGADEDRYRLVTADVFAALGHETFDVDYIQCFGFLYHTLRYPELFSRLRRLEPRHMVLDTRVHVAEDDTIKIKLNEATMQPQAAVDDFSEGTKTLVGSPSPSALRCILGVYGFSVEREYDWAAASRRGGVPLKKYKQGGRITWRCRWQAPHQIAATRAR
jgi:hypothetical protein